MEDIQVETVYGQGGHSVLLYAICRGQRVGYAWLVIDGCHARLIDVNVYQRKGRWSWWPPFYYRRVDYRGRGIGTRLLETIIEVCEVRGMSSLLGEMHGDIARLTHWYQRHGFQVGPGGVAIQLDVRQ